MTETETHQEVRPATECRPPYAHYFAKVPGSCTCGQHLIGRDKDVEERRQLHSSR